MPTYREDLHLGRKVPLIEADDIARGAITTEKLANRAVTAEKIDEHVLHVRHISAELEAFIAAQAKNIRIITQKEYDALAYKDPNILYIILDGDGGNSNPDNPDTPDNPDNPDTPDTPDTPADHTWRFGQPMPMTLS